MTTPSNELYRELPLTKGLVAIVDATDFEWLSAWKWSACITNKGLQYAHRGQNNRNYLMHREIMGLRFGDKRTVDHINHSGIDNRRCNLRIATHSQNCVNRRTREDNSSGLPGIAWNAFQGKWDVQLYQNRKPYYRGLHARLEEAVESQYRKNLELNGAFAIKPSTESIQYAIKKRHSDQLKQDAINNSLGFRGTAYLHGSGTWTIKGLDDETIHLLISALR